MVDDAVAMIYTDGGCIGNPGPGGYAALIRIAGEERIVVGGDPATTNNKMEMMAAIKALEDLPDGASAIVHSDSQYLIKGMTEWLSGWKRKGWRNSAKEPVKNRDLWEVLDALASRRLVNWQWVRGHNGHEENEKVDGLANAEAMRQEALLSSR